MGDRGDGDVKSGLYEVGRKIGEENFGKVKFVKKELSCHRFRASPMTLTIFQRVCQSQCQTKVSSLLKSLLVISKLLLRAVKWYDSTIDFSPLKLHEIYPTLSFNSRHQSFSKSSSLEKPKHGHAFNSGR